MSGENSEFRGKIYDNVVDTIGATPLVLAAVMVFASNGVIGKLDALVLVGGFTVFIRAGLKASAGATGPGEDGESQVDKPG